MAGSSGAVSRDTPATTLRSESSGARSDRSDPRMRILFRRIHPAQVRSGGAMLLATSLLVLSSASHASAGTLTPTTGAGAFTEQYQASGSHIQLVVTTS